MNIQNIATFSAKYNNTNIWSYVLYKHLHQMTKYSSFASFCIRALNTEDWDLEAAKEYTYKFYKFTYSNHRNYDYEHFDEAITAYIDAVNQAQNNPSNADSIISEVLYKYFKD